MTSLDPWLQVVALRAFDASLVNVKTPDWYLYLRADEAGFDALVTRDLSQSGQAEEMWTLTRTELSIVTWKKPLEDPVVEWGQMMAFLPEIRRMLRDHGPSILYLPRPHLDKERSLKKAGAALAEIGEQEGRETRDVREDAEQSVRAALSARGESLRFGQKLMVNRQGRRRGTSATRPGTE